jgi:hypothetical protein
MRPRRTNLLNYVTFGVIAIGFIFLAGSGLWFYNLATNNTCPQGEGRGSPGAPSFCVPASDYPTMTPGPTITPHAAYPAPSK